MNLKEIKLGLAVDLVNQPPQQEILSTVYRLVGRFRDILGQFNDVQLNDRKKFGSHMRSSYTLQYENATIDLDLLTNPLTHSQTVYGFNIK